MARLSEAQRRLVADQLAAWIRARVEDEGNDVDFAVENGMHLVVEDDLESWRPTPNGSATLVVRINGGARHTEGSGEEARDDAA